jgi:hypothetical protein
MKHPLRRVIAVGSAAAIAAMVVVPLASSTATAAVKPHGFNKAVAAKFILRMDRMRLTKSGHAGAIKGQTFYTSTNWSGYAETGGTYSAVSSTWKEPKITCSSSTKEANKLQLAAFWIGIDGFSDSTVEQDGTIEECKGSEYLGAADWWEFYPYNDVDIQNPVAQGDSITSAVSLDAATGYYTLSVSDKQDPSANFSASESCVVLYGSACSNSSAEWIAEAPCCNGSYEYDLAKWSPDIEFTKASVSGSAGTGTISSYASGADEDYIWMKGDKSHKFIAEVTATNLKGTSFEDMWKGYH